MIKYIFFLFFPLQLFSMDYTPEKIRTLYYSLSPTSISEHLAFYSVFPDTQEGKNALQDALRLLVGKDSKLSHNINPKLFDQSVIDIIVNLVNQQPNQKKIHFAQEQLQFIEELCQHLPNRKLKGHYAVSEEEVLQLPSEEVDLARGLFLSQFSHEADVLQKVKNYEATIDLMALQIIAKLPKKASDKQKITAINNFIFDEMGFRFPPHSVHAKNIDTYTFLPTVLDSRKGVCLGVSILYLCIAQRLSLPLEMITPPGHIYVRYRNRDNSIINIETTARGIHLDCEEYLSVDTRSLQQRNIKEVIGLAHFNQASVFWKENSYHKALESYQKAEAYLPHDLLLRELMAYTYLFLNLDVKAKILLEQVKDYTPPHAVYKETIAEDFLNGKVNADGIKLVFESIDETRESLLEKKGKLEKLVKRFPKFKAGVFHLASLWLQLNREGEALDILKKYHDLDPKDPTAEYYLSVLYMQRLNYKKAWEHLKNSERIAASKNHYPKVLKELRRELQMIFPD